MNKRCLHDGIVGAVVTLGILLGFYVNSAWLLLPIVIGLTLIQSAFTGFCPVYFAIDKYYSPDKLDTVK